jgi:transposase
LVRGGVLDDLGVPGLEELSREELLAVVKAQAVVVEQQPAELQEQAARIEALTAQVADLTRRLGQNSGNSSLPPSSDRFGKPSRDRRKPSPRKPGKQPGATGSTLGLVADPDEVVDHVPAAS